MLHTLTYPRRKYDEKNLDRELILKLIIKHQDIIASRLERNKNYYDGEHAICNKVRDGDAPNTKTVCNHAKDISDNATGYFMGNPITYNCGENKEEQEALDKLTTAFDDSGIDDVDSDNALDMSVYGVAYEYIFAKEGEAELLVRNLEAEYTFIVYDDSIEKKELFGVYYHPEKDDANNEMTYIATVVTENYKYTFNLKEKGDNKEKVKPKEHYMGQIPIIEYKNNKDNIGDFEQQISLIDAYNTLMSDRVNDKEQFIDAVLVLYGAILGDTTEETTEAKKKLRELKLLELPIDGKAEYLARTLDEAGAETLRKALKEDIYTFSHVPNLTDENFVGNSSGVAMEYKLLGLEMITKIKERYYKKGLRKRIAIFCHFLKLKETVINPKSVIPVFSRALPKNLVELGQLIANLKGSVSMKTLLQLLPFVESPEDEVEAVKGENEENIKQQRALFGNEPNDLPEGDVDEE